MQVLATAPGGIADQFPKDMKRLYRLIRRLVATARAGVVVRDRAGEGGRGGMIEVKDLTVRYGGVTSLDGMSITFEAGTCGLIGPERRGQDHVLQRAVRLRPPGVGVGARRSATTC